MRTRAPNRSPLSPASMRPSGVRARALMSTTMLGRRTSSFIRSRSVVPPARNCASDGARPAAARIAAEGESARSNMNGRMSGSFHEPFGFIDSIDNVGVGRAAAQISAHEFADLGVVARVPLANAADRRHDLSRRAVTTLKGIVVDEGLLHRMQRAVGSGEPLYRGDAAALCRGRKRQAGEYTSAVDQNRAGAALAVI